MKKQLSSPALRRAYGCWPLLGLALSLLACGAAPEPAPTDSPAVAPPECAPPAEVSDRPTTIAQALALANALPKPLTLPCYLRALGRPLALSAWLSIVSAQQASTAQNPRMFLRSGALTASVVPIGDGAHLLELAEDRPEHRSLKAELAFPIEQELPPSTPYDHALFTPEVTTCAFCHDNEQREALADGGVGFVSRALRPPPARRVPLSTVAGEAASCDLEKEPFRCQMLQALFAVEPPLDWDFPAEMVVCGG